jgi:hypothetical protein
LYINPGMMFLIGMLLLLHLIVTSPNCCAAWEDVEVSMPQAIKARTANLEAK